MLSTHGRRVLVPHSTLMALAGLPEGGMRTCSRRRSQVWEGNATTFDLWAGLLGGTTLAVTLASARRNVA